MGATQRLNLTHFLVRLASTSLDQDRLFQIALLVFRGTFGTAWPLGSLSDTSTDTVSIAAFLLSTCAWLRKAGRKINHITLGRFVEGLPDDFGNGGPAFVDSKLGQKANSSTGFNPSRWMYRLKRLNEIAQEHLAENSEWTIMSCWVRLKRGSQRP